MEDQELEALRAKRMAEMQAKAVSTSKYSRYEENFLVEITTRIAKNQNRNKLNFISGCWWSWQNGR